MNIKHILYMVLSTILFCVQVLCISCSKSNPASSSVTSPVVETASVSDITGSTAVCGGAVTQDGGDTVSERGVCWAEHENPTVDDSCTLDGSGVGEFVSYVTGLSENTSYYIRAYAANKEGTGYGMCRSFTTNVNQTVTLPVVTTANISDITANSVTCGGEVASDGGSEVKSRGLCWSEGAAPTVSNQVSINGAGTGSFTTTISGLSPNTTYHIRAYAKNEAGVGYGNEKIVTTNDDGCVTDIDGNRYETVKIGKQVWMAENLRVTRYRNGESVPLTEENRDWYYMGEGDGVTGEGAYCCYENNSENSETYGYLYNWYAVNDSRGLAPAGWHIPTEEEWQELESYLGMSQDEIDASERWRGTIEGGMLKQVGTEYWIYPNANATNETGFTALPGGHRETAGTFAGMGERANFWASTENPSGRKAWYRNLHNGTGEIYRAFYWKRLGFAVRCVKD